MKDPLKILVIDDEEDICRMFVKCLSLGGHVVAYALTGRQGINKMKKEHFHVVFLNVVMPRMMGLEVLERIKKISPKSKVIVMTGQMIEKKQLSLSKKKGASGFLQKPFSIDEIERAISS